MWNEGVAQLHAELCAALADPRRLQIVYLLAEEEMTVSELTSHLGISQPATSRHLKVLRSRGLVRATRVGQSVMYALSDRRVLDALETLRRVLFDNLQQRAQMAGNLSIPLP